MQTRLKFWNDSFFLNLDAAISIAYYIDNVKATKFRIEAREKLFEEILKNRTNKTNKANKANKTNKTNKTNNYDQPANQPIIPRCSRDRDYTPVSYAARGNGSRVYRA